MHPDQDILKAKCLIKLGERRQLEGRPADVYHPKTRKGANLGLDTGLENPCKLKLYEQNLIFPVKQCYNDGNISYQCSNTVTMVP